MDIVVEKKLKMEVEIWNMSSVYGKAFILLRNCLHKICTVLGQLIPCHGSGGLWVSCLPADLYPVII